MHCSAETHFATLLRSALLHTLLPFRSYQREAQRAIQQSDVQRGSQQLVGQCCNHVCACQYFMLAPLLELDEKITHKFCSVDMRTGLLMSIWILPFKNPASTRIS